MVIMDKKTINLLGWVLRGSQRIKVIKCLDKPKTPTMIKNETKLKPSNISDVLRALESKNLVKCLNPKSRMGRLYNCTKDGKLVQKEL